MESNPSSRSQASSTFLNGKVTGTTVLLKPRNQSPSETIYMSTFFFLSEIFLCLHFSETHSLNGYGSFRCDLWSMLSIVKQPGFALFINQDDHRILQRVCFLNETSNLKQISIIRFSFHWCLCRLGQSY